MDSLVAAGGSITPDDPLYSYTKGKPKSLLEIGGRTMLERVVMALADSDYVDHVVIVGISEADTPPTLARFGTRLSFLHDHGTLIRNVYEGIHWLENERGATEPILISTADIPLLTPAVVNAFVQECRPFDRLLYYNVVSREKMESRFPHSERTFVRLKGIAIAGGDLLLVHTRVIHTNQALWEAVIDARKHAWRLARIVGPWTLFKLLTRQLKLSEVESLAGRLLGEPVRILNSSHPELAMDVDRPQQVELLRRLLLTNEAQA